MLERYQVFDENNVLSMLKIRKTHIPWGIDLLIIDNHSLILAIQEPSSNRLRLGIKFYNKPDLVQPILEWYDNKIWDNSIPASRSQVTDELNRL